MEHSFCKISVEYSSKVSFDLLDYTLPFFCEGGFECLVKYYYDSSKRKFSSLKPIFDVNVSYPESLINCDARGEKYYCPKRERDVRNVIF